jgi:hypothetical protein
MRIVLQTLASRLDLRAVDSRPERIIRRAITMSPARGGEVVAHERVAHPPAASALAA